MLDGFAVEALIMVPLAFSPFNAQGCGESFR